MKSIEKFGVSGHLTINTVCKETGEIIDSFDENNVITIQGFGELLTRITQEATTTPVIDGWLYQFVLGDDVGTGDVFTPEPANENLNDVSQSVIYSVPNTDMNLTFVSSKVIEYGTVLDGTAILDSLFPSEVDIRFTSATMRFKNGKVFAYKRFPVRSLSRLVDVQIIWRFTFS